MKKAADTIPNNGRVTVKLIEDEEKSPIYTGKEKELPQKGVVVAIGKRLTPKDKYCSLGDIVVFGKYAGVAYNFLDGEHITIFERELITKL